jgi:outer membrane protein
MKLITKCVAGAVIAAASLTAMADMKVAVVNYMQVFQQAPQGNATAEQLKAQLQPQMDKLKDQQASLEQQAQDLQKNAPTMTASERKAKQQALDQEQQAFQQQVSEARNTVMQNQENAQQTFISDMQTAINQVAKSGHYDMILNSQAVPYYDGDYDVTSQVVQIMQNMK